LGIFNKDKNEIEIKLSKSDIWDTNFDIGMKLTLLNANKKGKINEAVDKIIDTYNLDRLDSDVLADFVKLELISFESILNKAINNPETSQRNRYNVMASSLTYYSSSPYKKRREEYFDKYTESRSDFPFANDYCPPEELHNLIFDGNTSYSDLFSKKFILNKAIEFLRDPAKMVEIFSYTGIQSITSAISHHFKESPELASAFLSEALIAAQKLVDSVDFWNADELDIRQKNLESVKKEICKLPNLLPKDKLYANNRREYIEEFIDNIKQDNVKAILKEYANNTTLGKPFSISTQVKTQEAAKPESVRVKIAAGVDSSEPEASNVVDLYKLDNRRDLMADMAICAAGIEDPKTDADLAMIADIKGTIKAAEAEAGYTPLTQDEMQNIAKLVLSKREMQVK
jgi:hypothetical protein